MHLLHKSSFPKGPKANHFTAINFELDLRSSLVTESYREKAVEGNFDPVFFTSLPEFV